MNRDPHFWKNTKFLIDRFHWKNHSACANRHMRCDSRDCVCRCSKSFCLDRYHDLHGINSSIAEQYHSYLRRVRDSAKH